MLAEYSRLESKTTFAEGLLYKNGTNSIIRMGLFQQRPKLLKNRTTALQSEEQMLIIYKLFIRIDKPFLYMENNICIQYFIKLANYITILHLYIDTFLGNTDRIEQNMLIVDFFFKFKKCFLISFYNEYILSYMKRLWSCNN